MEKTIIYADGRKEQWKDLEGKELALHQVAKLKVLMNYSEEIPNEIVHSFNPNNEYKVRRTWFSTLGLRMQKLISGGILDDSLADEYKETWNDLNSRIGQKGYMTTREDIDKANSYVSKVINYLDSNFGH